MRIALLALLTSLLAPAQALAVSWARPVSGEVTRAFFMRGSPFAAGQHRGVDLATSAGAAVGAPCDGRVVVAARIGSSDGVVTVRCGPWRASVLPLAGIAVRRGAPVSAGDPVGTSQTGSIHVGVRRAGVRFGYVDPVDFLPLEHSRPPLAPAGPGERPTRPARPAPASPLASSPASPFASSPAVRLASSPARTGVMPWPAWLGAALLLAGGSGGVVRRRRTRRVGLRVARTSWRTR
jgi:hypothetical protein